MEKSDNLNPTSASDKLLVEIVRAIETTNNIFGKGGSGSTTPLVLNSVEYTSAGIQTTTAGKNTVMITCVDGVEKINDIVMPAGVYTFQPTLNNTVAAISVDAMTGRIIVQEL